MLTKFSLPSSSPLFFLLPLLIGNTSCEKAIEVDLPDHEPKYVVEGYIEQNQPPYVILTRSMGYFDPSAKEDLENSFVHDAKITVSDGTRSTVLVEYCFQDLNGLERSLFSEALGISPFLLRETNYCLYSIPKEDFLDNTYFRGAIGGTYSLKIETEESVITASTTIPTPIPLDSLWYVTRASTGNDGVIWGRLSDPPTPGNTYRWQARILNKGSGFIAPPLSASQDVTFNGSSIDFFYLHGNDPDREEDTHYYGEGSRVAIKFSAIDSEFYRFLRLYENEIANQGNPFASPTTIIGNIEGANALGVWGGYGATYDTIVCK